MTTYLFGFEGTCQAYCTVHCLEAKPHAQKQYIDGILDFDSFTYRLASRPSFLQNGDHWCSFSKPIEGRVVFKLCAVSQKQSSGSERIC